MGDIANAMLSKLAIRYANMPHSLVLAFGSAHLVHQPIYLTKIMFSTNCHHNPPERLPLLL